MLATSDRKKYGRLPAAATPVAIRSEAENDRALAIVKRLMAKGEIRLTPEQDALLEILTQPIEDFEESAYPVGKPTPRDALESLLEQQDLKATDLWPVVGSKSRVSEILSGNRSISKEQAKRLAEFFRVPVDLFV